MSVNAVNLNTKSLLPLNNTKLSNFNRIPENSKQQVERSFTKRMTLPNIPLPKSTSTNPEKKFVSVYKQREIEYDKNLRSIKSNLFENKFKNLSVNPKENSNNVRRGSTFQFVNRKNAAETKNSVNSNINTRIPFNNENKNVNVIRERSRSGTKKTNLLDRMKTTPGESSEGSGKFEVKDQVRYDSLNSIKFEESKTKIENLEIYGNNMSNDPSISNMNKVKNTNVEFDNNNNNFNLIDDKINETDLKIFDKNKNEILFEFSQNYPDETNIEFIIEDKSKDSKINFDPLPKSDLELEKKNPLDLIIKENKDNILDLNDKSMLELYIKDDLIFIRSDLKTEDKTINYLSKSSKIENNPMTKSIDELFNIERLFENTIPIHSIEYQNTSDRKLNLQSIKQIKRQPHDREFLNYKFFQENVNKINLAVLTLNYENLRLNKECRAKFTQDEYRSLLSAFLRFDYGKGILEEFHKTEESNLNFLCRHDISERMRVKMIDWMIEVLTNYKCEESTYFLAVDLMDRYFKHSKKILKPDDLHLIGICCMFISSKFYDIYPIKLKIVSEKISHNKFSPDDIKNMEDEIIKTLNYNLLKPTAWEFVNFFLEEIFYFIENNFMISDDTLSQYIKGMCINGEIEIKIDCVYYEKLKNTRKFNNTVMSLLRNVVLYLLKMNCHDYNLISIKPSLNAASSLFVGLKICGQINNEEYMNEYFFKKLVEVSKHTENDILANAQKILYNAQNFDIVFPNLENLKRVHFNHILEIGYREKF